MDNLFSDLNISRSFFQLSTKKYPELKKIRTKENYQRGDFFVGKMIGMLMHQISICLREHS